MRVILLLCALLVGHLRTSRKRGRHNEKTHGTRAGFGADGPKAFRKRQSDKGRKIAGAKPYKRPVAKKPVFNDDDDPFAEDDFGDEPESKDDARQRRYEEQQIKALEKAERSRVHSAVMEAGGLQTRDDLREEYREIPNTFKRKDGLPGDEMADYMSTYYPEFGIEDERDLIDFLAV